MEEVDVYKTVQGSAKGLYKEKGSKFIGYVFHIESEEEARQQLLEVKKQYHDARHHCYAYRVNPENETYRSNDDGEPSGTAGKPILNQILSFELYDVLVVVVRYFGGTKLGVSGLIRAYKTAAIDALSQAKVVTNTITRTIRLQFDYPLMNVVMRIIKEEQLDILNQQFEMSCAINLEVQKNREEIIRSRFEQIYGVDVK